MREGDLLRNYKWASVSDLAFLSGEKRARGISHEKPRDFGRCHEPMFCSTKKKFDDALEYGVKALDAARLLEIQCYYGLPNSGATSSIKVKVSKGAIACTQ